MSLSQSTLTRSVLVSVLGLQISPEPFSGRSEHAMSQSPEPVEPRVIIVPESVREPSIGLEITETGFELFT